MRVAGIATVLGVVATLTAAGCIEGLSKREDAAEESDEVLRKLTRRLARELEPQTNVSRASGAVVYLRLKRLFPYVSTTGQDRVLGREVDYMSPLHEDRWFPSKARGRDRAMVQADRPTNALAQIAMREKVTLLCNHYLRPSETREGALFSTTGILLEGEALPEDPEVRLAFATARNAWLAAYPADSPEVGTLVELFRATLAQGGSALEARQALCNAALLAGQFWIGTLRPEEPIRRLALELGRRTPRFEELDAYLRGSLTVAVFVESLQRGEGLERYLEALNDWHRKWLGLRPVYDPDNFLSGLHNFDPRPTMAGFTTNNGYPALTYTQAPRIGGVMVHGTQAGEDCSHLQEDGVTPNVQPFDPRTTMIVWEHRNPQRSGRWEVVAGWVLPGHLPEYKALINAYLPAYSDADLAADCVLVPPADPIFASGRYPAALPNYYRCRGRVEALELGRFVTTAMGDLHLGYRHPTEESTSIYYGGPADEETYRGTSTRLSQLGTTVARTFQSGDRRARRYSPTGRQNGISLVRRWYGNSPGYVCNSMSRFVTTCAYRTPNSTWFNIVDGAWFADSHILIYGLTWRPWQNAHPFALNLFHCGIPDKAAIAARPPDAPYTPVETGFPRGYALEAYDSPAEPLALNDRSHRRQNDADGFYYTSGPESAALRRLLADLDQEPYRLLEHVIRERRPYSELFTATYTRGREELELHYRSQGHILPFHPDGYTATAPDDPARLEVRTIDFTAFEPMPLGWFRRAYGALGALPGATLPSGPGQPREFAQVLPPEFVAAGAVTPKHAAGVLTMPAFLMPLAEGADGAPKMRTIASRYFLRLLCGMPNVYDPLRSGGAALHESFMAAGPGSPPNPAANASAQQHLDRKSECYQCHVNLDPLAQALSANFLSYTQLNETVAAWGEHDPSPQVGRDYARSAFGSRSGGFPSRGAFLGRPVEGVQGVARALVESPLWGACVAQQVLENLAGRPIAFSDVKVLKELTDRFMAHQDLDRLIRELAESPVYLRKD
jgi:hypothetical protein